MASETEHSRVVTWHDPMISARAAATMSGLEYLQKYINGELPPAPISRLLNYRLAEASYGRAVFEGTPDESLYNPIGTVHGGFAATLLDSALGCAVHTTLVAGMGYATAELHVNLLRPITAQTGILRSEGDIIHAGRQIVLAQARITDASGKIYAHGTATCMIFPINESK